MFEENRAVYQDTSVLGNFIDNHDNRRFLNHKNSWPMYMNAMAYVLFSEGIPMIYYGAEQGFTGGHDPHCREILWNSMDQESELYVFLKTAVRVRKEQEVWNYE